MKSNTRKLIDKYTLASTLIAALVITSAFSTSANAALTVLTVGDSITSGLKLNSSRTNWYCPADGVRASSFINCRGNGVLNRGGFQPDITQLFSQQGITANVYNWGFNGEESWELVARITQAMNSRTADTVFFMAGVNDLNDNVSDQTTAFNVEMMMDSVKERGLTPIVGTITPHLGESSYNPKIVRINALIRAAANDKRIAVAEHYQALIPNWGAHNSGDGLHVGDSGDAIIAEQWLEAYELSKSLKVTITPILQLLLD